MWVRMLTVAMVGIRGRIGFCIRIWMSKWRRTKRKKRSDENEGGLNIEGATGEFMKKAKDDSRDVFQDIVEKVRATCFLPYKFAKVSFQVRAKVATCFLSLDFILLPELPMV